MDKQSTNWIQHSQINVSNYVEIWLKTTNAWPNILDDLSKLLLNFTPSMINYVTIHKQGM